MPKVIAITNQKGGIGKTSSAIAIATIMNKRGYKALLIDADPQGNASDTYRAKIDHAATLYDVLLETDRVSIQEAIQHTPIGDIVAGDSLLRRADAILASDMGGAFRLKNALDGLEGYDYVIIDTPPRLDELTKNALIAADEVIIPVTAERYAIQGLSIIFQSIQAIKKNGLNRDIKLAGILLAAYQEKTKIGKEVKEELEEIAEKIGTKVLQPPIRRTIKVREAHAARLPIIDYDPKCTAAKDYVELVAHILEG